MKMFADKKIKKISLTFLFLWDWIFFFWGGGGGGGGKGRRDSYMKSKIEFWMRIKDENILL